jgi:hypothetical protein
MSSSLPNGGFPPLFIRDKIIEKKKEENKNREFISHKNTVSILEILKKRNQNLQLERNNNKK